MASNGLLRTAKTGKCRMCFRVRNTDKHLKAVGEVNHGYAIGHIWECKDVEDCDKTMQIKLGKYHPESPIAEAIRFAQKLGRATFYIYQT